MSELLIEECWSLGGYLYPFYRFVIEKHLYPESQKNENCIMLDAGCGSKVCSISKIPENVTVIGLDSDCKAVYSSHMLAKKKGYENLCFIIGSLTHLPLRSDIFDICVCIDVLNHLPNKNDAIAEISRVCKPRAKFVGSTSNSLNPILLFDSLAPKVLIKPLTWKFAPGHFERHKRLNPKKLIQTLERQDFQVQDITLLGFPPFQPWIYHYRKKKIPVYAYFWILLDKITNKPPLSVLKEVMVFNATKRIQSS